MDHIRLDYQNVMADAIGTQHGLRDEQLAELSGRAQEALAAVQARRTTDLRWLDLPSAKEVIDDIQTYADSVRGKFRNVVVLGIGGSALGNTALFSALCSPYHNDSPPGDSPRLFVLDNVDPDLVGEWIEHFDPVETLFNVISKSGGTAET
ncbi:MAG: glucose-6-phosphate isomerase, partial [Planctomycetota bacterium]